MIEDPIEAKKIQSKVVMANMGVFQRFLAKLFGKDKKQMVGIELTEKI